MRNREINETTLHSVAGAAAGTHRTRRRVVVSPLVVGAVSSLLAMAAFAPIAAAQPGPPGGPPAPGAVRMPEPGFGLAPLTPDEALRVVLDRIEPETDRARIAASTREALDAGIHAGLLAEVVERARLSGTGTDRTVTMLERARGVADRGLPPEPVLDRYLQGMAKGVPFARIEGVATQLEERLDQAAGIFDDVVPEALRREASAPRGGDGAGAGVLERGPGPASTPGDRSPRRPPPPPLDARGWRGRVADHGAYALGAGASPDALRDVLTLPARESAPAPAYVPPVLTLGILVSAGMTVERSVEIVRTSWEHGVRGPELEWLGRMLGSAGRPGEGPPPSLVDQVLGRLRAGEDHMRILDDLDRMHPRGPRGPVGPGAQPGEDPTHMHGPGGPPESPGRPPVHGPGGPGRGHGTTLELKEERK